MDNHKERLVLRVEENFKELVCNICKVTGESSLEVCSVLFMNGVDLLLATVDDDLKTLNIPKLRREVTRPKIMRMINEINTYHKLKGGNQKK